jgi:two-component system chemotaxis response regulator CheB
MGLAGRTRILIVDDSVVMRSLLRTVVCADAGLEVVGSAADGASALIAVESGKPDLVLLDVEMPVMDGLATVRELRKRGHTMPVIMCSSLTQRGGRVTIEALASGATDYVAKPSGQSGRDAAVLTLSQELLPKIRALTGAGQAPRPRQPILAPSVSGIVRLPLAASVFKPQPVSSNPEVVVIGVSTGGPAALDRVLPTLPASFRWPVVIVQHMPEVFTALLAERLNGRCSLQVREAKEGDAVCPGIIYIARGNWHLELHPAVRATVSSAVRPQPTLHLSQGPLENHCRPAVDVLFRSAVEVYGSGVLGVVLTGMGSDGLIGCRMIRECGGSVLAQDQPTSTVWGMPGAVANAGLAHKVLPLDAIGPEICRIASRTPTDARGLLRSAV